MQQSKPTADAADRMSKSYVLTMPDIKNAVKLASGPAVTKIFIPKETMKAVKRGRPKKVK